MQERMENIEIRCLYLEKTVDELNSVVIEQQKEIRELRQLITLLASRLVSAPEMSQDPDEKPPHY